MSNYPRFQDFSEEDRRLEGGKVKISDVVNKDILVTGFLVGKSRYNNEKSEQKEYLTLEFKFGEEGEKHILSCGVKGQSVKTPAFRPGMEAAPLLTFFPLAPPTSLCLHNTIIIYAYTDQPPPVLQAAVPDAPVPV